MLFIKYNPCSCIFLGFDESPLRLLFRYFIEHRKHNDFTKALFLSRSNGTRH